MPSDASGVGRWQDPDGKDSLTTSKSYWRDWEELIRSRSLPTVAPLVFTMYQRPLPVVRCRCAAQNLRWVVALACLTAVGCFAARRQVAERREACDSLCQQARTAKNEGWPDQADLLLNEAVRQRPDDLETRRQIAETMWDCERKQDAVAEFRELAKTHPRDIRLHQRLAVMSWTLDDRDQAAESAERALRLDPSAPVALLVKARSEAARREFDSAVTTYIRLARAAPDLIDAKLELAEVHVERGNSRQACTLLRDVITHPSLTEAQKIDAEWKLGLAYASADRWTESATHLSNSIESRDSTAGDWQLLLTARKLAGQEPGSLPSKAVLVSSQGQTESGNSAWTSLRDRLLNRSETIIGAGNVPAGGVVRADFSKSANARSE